MFVPQQDWIVQNSSTTGLGAFELSGDPPIGTSYFPFRHRFANGATVPTYWVINPTRTKWEKYRNETLTYGTLDELSRNNIEASTNSDGPVNWQPEDMPLLVYIVPDIDALGLAMAGNAGATRHALLSDGALWPDTTNGWAGRVPFQLNPAGTEREAGAWEGSRGIWLPSRNRLVLANGAANLTLTTNHANWVVSFDNSAASRTATLPALSSVPDGFSIAIYGLSQAFILNLAPNGTDVIDFGSAGQTLPLPGKTVVEVWADKSGTAQWRTSFDYSAEHVLTASDLLAAAAYDLRNLPYWVNGFTLDFDLTPGTNAVGLLAQFYDASDVLINGASTYGYFHVGGAGVNGTAFSMSNGSLINTATQASNGQFVASNIRKTATKVSASFRCHYLNSGSARHFTVGGGELNSTGAASGARIVMSSGTMTGNVTARVKATKT